MAAPARDVNYWNAIADNVQNLIANGFRAMQFAGPAHQLLAARNIPVAGANQKWIPAPHPDTQPSGTTSRTPIPRHGLHAGAEGLVNLWCLVDTTNNRILDKISVKQVHPGAVAYLDRRNWQNGQVSGMPLEVAMADAIYAHLAQADRQYMVEYLGYGDCVGAGKWRYRVYQEYALYGTLTQRIEAQRLRKVGKKTEGQKLLPEPFLWMIFEALAKVLVAMDQVPNGGVMHGDLHPGNIFFGDPDQNRFAMYPTPKVADFGSTRSLRSHEVAHRTNFLLGDGCHPSYYPPELARDDTFLGWEIQATPTMQNKINVWQLGMAMACCMRLRPFLQEARWRGFFPLGQQRPEAEQLRFAGDTGVRELPLNKLAHGNSHYSPALIRLVGRCMRFDPTHRPTPGTLLAIIQHRMQNRLQGVDTYRPPANGRVHARMKKYQLRRRNEDNKYQLGRVLR